MEANNEGLCETTRTCFVKQYLKGFVMLATFSSNLLRKSVGFGWITLLRILPAVRVVSYGNIFSQSCLNFANGPWKFDRMNMDKLHDWFKQSII